ncbi:MAG: hypothetical protein WCL50_00760 [Spirochaetota bacterium]
MRTFEGFLVLLRELDGDVVELAKVVERNRRAWERIRQGAKDSIDWGALGFTLQTAYGVIENYFLRISKFFENGLPSKAWHKALVDRMSLEIPGLRPALLISDEDRQAVQELLKFRHRIRNLYGEDLDPAKTEIVQKSASALFDRFAAIHRDFRERLSAIAEQVQ